MKHRTRITFAIVAAFAASGAVLASDGLYQISETCVGTGCFPGDSFDFPVTITEPGSYQLTSDLEVAGINTTAIKVEADGVTIDLNGFEIRGPSICTYTTAGGTTCSAAGNGIGIDNSAGGRLTVHNGRVTGMGFTGIRASNSSGTKSSHVYDVTVANNPWSGISMRYGVVRNVVGEFNGRGVDGSGSNTLRVIDSVFKMNTQYGVYRGYCSGIVSVLNGSGSTCFAGLGPNVCETPANCN